MYKGQTQMLSTDKGRKKICCMGCQTNRQAKAVIRQYFPLWKMNIN